MWKDIPADEGSLMMSSFHSPDRDTGPKRGWSCPKTELPVYMGGGGVQPGLLPAGNTDTERHGPGPQDAQSPQNQFSLETLLPHPQPPSRPRPRAAKHTQLSLQTEVPELA